MKRSGARRAARREAHGGADDAVKLVVETTQQPSTRAQHMMRSTRVAIAGLCAALIVFALFVVYVQIQLISLKTELAHAQALVTDAELRKQTVFAEVQSTIEPHSAHDPLQPLVDQNRSALQQLSANSNLNSQQMSLDSIVSRGERSQILSVETDGKKQSSADSADAFSKANYIESIACDDGDRSMTARELCRCKNSQHYADDKSNLFKRGLAYLIHQCSSPRETQLERLAPKRHRKVDPHKLCIVVPFRDSLPSASSSSESALLAQLIAAVEAFLRKHEPGSTLLRQHVWVVVNQTDSNLRFNRGRLLNLGAAVSFAQLGCDYIAAHDVDLRPLSAESDGARTLSYSFPRESDLLHLAPAAVHPTYWKTRTFFGGALLATERAMRRSNGFPDHFWGWGREDDYLKLHAKWARLRIASVLDGAFENDDDNTLISGKLRDTMWHHEHGEYRERDVRYVSWNKGVISSLRNVSARCLFRDVHHMPDLRDGLWELSHRQTDLIDTTKTCLDYVVASDGEPSSPAFVSAASATALAKSARGAEVVVVQAALTCHKNLTPHCELDEDERDSRADAVSTEETSEKRELLSMQSAHAIHMMYNGEDIGDTRGGMFRNLRAAPCWNATGVAEMSCACINDAAWAESEANELSFERIRECSGEPTQHSDIERGGAGGAQHKLCLIVPYRNVWPQVETLVPYMESFLDRQRVQRVWIIVNQSDHDILRFNRGRLLNLGAVAAFRQFGCDYVAFHDVDLLPISDEIPYTFPADDADLYQLSPHYIHPHYPGFANFFGGNLLVTERAMRRSNGYSDHLWGWGKEDDVFKLRVEWSDINVAGFPRPDLPEDERVRRYWRHEHVEESRPRDMKMLTMNREMLFDIRDGPQCLFRDSADAQRQSMFDGYREVERAGTDMWDAQRTCWKKEFVSGANGESVAVVVIDAFLRCDATLTRHCAQAYNVKPKAKVRDRKKLGGLDK